MHTKTILFSIGTALPLALLALACGSSDSDGSSSDSGSSNSTTDGGSSGTHANGGSSGAHANGGSSAANDGGDSSGTHDGGGAGDESDSGNLATNGGPASGIAPVELGTAGDYAILAKSGISTVPPSAVTGNIAVSPAAASYITGFSLTADSTNKFATSPQVTGKAFAANYASPTPSKLTKAVSDMELAFTDAASRAADVTELGAGDIGEMTLAPGVYSWGTGLLIPKDVTLNGNATDVWIFQIAKDLTVSSGTDVVLTGGALASNVFWQVAGKVVFGTTAHVEGVVLTHTSITLKTGASIHGRLLAQTAVAIDSSTIVKPEN
jgi:hypothetical protein